MHDSTDFDTSNQKKKPKMILFYNANKVGVDCFHRMTRLCTKRSASRRWPVAVWGNILNIAAINSYVMYKRVTSNRIIRRQFILMLIENLLGKSEPCLSNSNRQFKQDDEGVRKRRKCHGVCCGKCHGVCCDNKTVSTCILCHNLLVKDVHKTISE